jgi:very-short-patch-repair endonuclease
VHVLKHCGCPKCNETHGERLIRLWLEQHSIHYEFQKHFEDCVYKKPLFFDFFVSKYQLCIEFDGKQHFREGIGGKVGRYTFTTKDWHLINNRDAVKNQWCNENGIRLLRIDYTQINDIKNILQRCVR